MLFMRNELSVVLGYVLATPSFCLMYSSSSSLVLRSLTYFLKSQT